MEKIVIIGAGPAGIGAALGLKDDGLVLEQSSDAGGLSQTITIDGAVFDFGGHSFHTPHPMVRDLVFDAVDMYEQTRNAQCFAAGELIPYPFQMNFRRLSDAKLVQDCVDGLSESDAAADADNFEEFIMRRFGPGIAKHFMLPYNRKLWGCDLTRLAADWTGERVAAPEGQAEEFDTDGGVRKPLQPSTSVAYPARGGFGEIYKALSRRIHDLRLGQQVTRIDPKTKRLWTQSGEVFNWYSLVSTLPLPILLKFVDGVPEWLKAKAEKLDALSLKLGLVVVGHQVDTDIQRIYSAESDIPAHKIAINHNSSDYLRSLPHHGIMAEISTVSAKSLGRRDLKHWIVESLQKTGIIKDDTVIRHVEIRDVKYAYPVPKSDRDIIVNEIKEWLGSLNIHTVGRFGEWAYINSDEAIFRGLLLGRRLAGEVCIGSRQGRN